MQRMPSSLFIMLANSYNFTSSGKAFLNSSGNIKWSLFCISLAHLLHTSLLTCITLLQVIVYVPIFSLAEVRSGKQGLDYSYLYI